MAQYEMQATLRIKFLGDSNAPEESLDNAVKDRSYEVVSAQLDKVLPEGYISIAELAHRLGYTSPRYIRRRCAAGAIPGAKKTGRDWYVPESTDYFNEDHRETSGGKYAGWHKKYGKGRSANAAEPPEE